MTAGPNPPPARTHAVLPEQIPAENLFHSLYEHMRDGMVVHELVVDASGRPVNYRLLDINPAAEAILQMPRDAVIGKLATDVYGVDDPPYLEEFTAVTTTGQSARMEVYFAPMSRWFSISAFSPGPNLFATVFADVTEQKKIEQEILLLNEALAKRVKRRTEQVEATNEELESFAHSVTHDLRAPLRAVAGFARILEEDHAEQLDSEGRAYVRRICRAAERMSALLDSLRTLFRVSKSVMDCGPVNLSRLATRLANELQAQDPRAGVDVSIASDLTVYGDAHLMEVALRNLLHNAWKFTRTTPSAHIEFGRSVDGENAVFFVRDNGVGFDMEYVHRLFTPFQRLHSPEQFEGTGVGLAAVQRIVHRHGGRIWAEGKIDGGAIFYFTIPMYASKESTGSILGSASGRQNIKPFNGNGLTS